MTRPVLSRHRARTQPPNRHFVLSPLVLSPQPLVGAVVLLVAVLVATLAPSPAGPVSLGRVRPVAMSNRQLSDRAEYHPYYARRLGHRMTRNFGYRSDRQWHCLRRLWRLESSWRVHADNRYSRAYGIPQANPGRKMSSAGDHWWRNAETQIRWGLHYVRSRYSTPCGAMHHKRLHGWY